MKKIFILSVTFAAMFASTALFSAEIRDDFSNPWGSWSPAKAKVSYVHKDGTSAIVIREGHVLKNGGCLIKNFPVKAEKNYCAVIKVSGKIGRVSLSPQAMNSKRVYMQVISGGHSITNLNGEAKICINFKTPKNCAFLRIVAGADGVPGEKAVFDDFVLTEIDPAVCWKEPFNQKGWNSWKAAGSKFKVGFSPTVGHDAPGSIFIEIPQDASLKKTACFTKHCTVKPGKEYTFLVYAKTENIKNPGTISLNVQGQTAKYKFLNTGVQGTSISTDKCSDWNRLVFTFRVPTTGKWANCGNLLITLGFGKTYGKVYFDDFEFFENETDEE